VQDGAAPGAHHHAWPHQRADADGEGTSMTAGAAGLEALREHWDAVVAHVAARDRVHGEWARWCWPRSLRDEVVEIDTPIREQPT
jgi:hypothetical protein